MSRSSGELAVREDDVGPAAPVQIEVPRPSLLQVVWYRRWSVFATVILCMAAALTSLLQATPIYTSTSRVYVEQSGPKIISEYEGVMTESKNYLYTQSELLRSTPILASTLEQPGIKQLRSFADVDNHIGFLKKELDVEVGKKDDIISVAFDSAWPEEAARVVNAVVEAYVTYHSKIKRSTATEVLKILQKEKDRRDTELTKKLQAVLKFQRENGTLSLSDDRGNIVIQRLAKLSDELTNVQLEVIDSRATYDAAKAMIDDPAKVRQLMQALHGGGGYISWDREESEILASLSRLETHLVALEQRCAEGSPATKAAKTKIAKLREQLAEREKRFAEAYLAAVHQKWSAANEKKTELEAALDEQRKLAEELNVKVAEFAILQTDLKRTEKACDILDTRIKEINVTEDTGALNITILEVAKPEDKPTKPAKARIMAMALVVGLMLGVGLGLVRDWMDQRLRSSEEISAMLGVPVLGVIPSMTGKHDLVTAGLTVHKSPSSHIAEAYRTIRTGVYFGAPDGQAKTVLVTSPAPGDGKTTSVSNLAIAMAQAGQKVLIVDADFRRPRQHAIFDLKNEVGLSSILAGRGSLAEAIQSTEVAGLDVLPCGPIPPNPSEMLNSQAFLNALEDMSQRYDHIVLDSPPVMPVTDARILGAMCGVTLLILRAERSTRKAAEHARDGLLSVGAGILGAVVNAVPRKKGRYGYYGYGYGYYRYGRYGYGYGYGHGYGYGQEKRKEKKKRTEPEPETVAASDE